MLKGLFIEVSSLIALFLGVYGATHFSNFAETFIRNSTHLDNSLIKLSAFAITFIVIVIAISIIGRMMTKLIDYANLGLLNQLLGGVFGALKLALIISVLLIFFEKFNNTIPLVRKETINKSKFYSPVRKIVPTLFPTIMNNLGLTK